MPGEQDIKRHIKSVKSTQQITKAMKMVAASKLRKTQKAAVISRPYTEKLEQLLEHVIASLEVKTHSLMIARPVKNVGIVLLTSDRGLAGGYNTNLLRMVATQEAKFKDVGIKYIAVGRKGFDFVRKGGRDLQEDFSNISDTPEFVEAKVIAELVVNSYEEGMYDEVYLAYQQFISTIQQQPVLKKLLPIAGEAGAAPSEYIFEPHRAKVLDVLLPKYIDNEVYHALLEAKASEHGARMVAMGASTDNANEMLEKLALSYNRARQAAITREISEIVAGANALS